MSVPTEFREILTPDAPLGKWTSFGTGGSAEWTARPRGVEELGALCRACRAEGIPFRIFGGGSNILVPDAGVKGVVVRLAGPPFDAVSVAGSRVTAGAGALLSEAIAASCRASLSGLESLVGIPG
ncbi:MAG: FAD-binding protein, partial [Planctomycetia bacterium]